ncbi:MAG: T9SS type A sorting domain-containing protein [Saprospiraceae bacterium]|nr:T9SS type A sorting domain-containing protein [Saprospiraceae bacterium]
MKPFFLFITFFSLCCSNLNAQLPKPFLLKNINPVQGASANIGNLTEFKDYLYFGSYDFQNDVGGLWKSNGTSSGTYKLKNITAYLDDAEKPFIELNGKLYFKSYDPTSSYSSLWSTDGTSEGTKLVSTINTVAEPGIYELTPFNNKLYFRANGASGVGLWVSDGTEAGTQLVKAFEQANTGNTYPHQLRVVGDKLLFLYGEGTVIDELWMSDGTTDGTMLLKEFPSQWGTIIDGFTPMGNKILFVINDGSGPELWITDKTTTGTYRLGDFQNLGATNPFVIYNNEVFFNEIDSLGQTSLCKSDGTVNGKVKLTQFSGFSANNFVEMKGWLYFIGTPPMQKNRLWRTDGTPENTVLLDSSDYSIPIPGDKLFKFQDKLYFMADDYTTTERDFYVSDGELGGTQLFKDLVPGENDDPVGFFECPSQSKFYFYAYKDSSGYLLNNALYSSDGTVENTQSIALNYRHWKSRFFLVGDLLYLISSNQNMNDVPSLWLTDGTTAGSHQMVADNADYVAIISSAKFKVYKDKLVFTNQFSLEVGEELYIINPDGSSDTKEPNTSPQELNLYPNPSTGTVYFELSKTAGTPILANIYSSNGQLMESMPLKGNSKDFSATFPVAGTYIVNVIFENGGSVSKIILIH